MKKKVALHNLGCKVNSYELEAMQQLLEQAGYEIVPFEPGADVYVINTCTVTNIADRKSRQMLHKAKKMNPDTRSKSQSNLLISFTNAFTLSIELSEIFAVFIVI